METEINHQQKRYAELRAAASQRLLSLTEIDEMLDGCRLGFDVTESARRLQVSTQGVRERMYRNLDAIRSDCAQLLTLCERAPKTLTFDQCTREMLEAEITRCNEIMLRDGRTIGELREQLVAERERYNLRDEEHEVSWKLASERGKELDKLHEQLRQLGPQLETSKSLLLRAQLVCKGNYTELVDAIDAHLKAAVKL